MTPSHRTSELSDHDLVAAVFQVVATPKVEPASSFVLHAPLEVAARSALLRRVRPEGRDVARRRLVEVADAYTAEATPLPDPAPLADDDIGSVTTRLVDTIGAGDLDDADRSATRLTQLVTGGELPALLAAPLSRSLSAAGHAGILFQTLAADGDVPAAALRGMARELARHPDWALPEIDLGEADRAGSGTETHLLEEALLAVPSLGVPGNAFIQPVMDQALRSGVADRLLAALPPGGLEPGAARSLLSRVAAWSMLQDDPEHAPYGWSHCLTMPQGVLSPAVDDPHRRGAVAVGATYVAGFRAALGSVRLDPSFVPESVATADLVDAIADSPLAAAAVAWHAPPTTRDDVATTLATVASAHHDAHLVKYTLSCFRAAAYDPDHTPLYLASAAYLAGWWAKHDDR
jgi:hypothetical protein